MQKTLSKYFPEELLTLVESIIKDNRVHFVISRDRKSKAGDYKSPYKKEGHRISVNGSLNKYAFTITFFHEYAHLLVWENYRNKVSPHGNEWKSIFSKMLIRLIKSGVFPSELSHAVKNYAINPKASSHSDIYLTQVLKKYDSKSENNLKSIFEILPGTKFKLENGRIFVRGEIKRTRIWCKELNTNNIFAFNPNAEVLEL